MSIVKTLFWNNRLLLFIEHALIYALVDTVRSRAARCGETRRRVLPETANIPQNPDNGQQRVSLSLSFPASLSPPMLRRPLLRSSSSLSSSSVLVDMSLSFRWSNLHPEVCALTLKFHYNANWVFPHLQDFQEQMKGVSFKELVIRGRELTGALVTALINVHIQDDASVDQISGRMREICPLVYTKDDSVCSKVTSTHSAQTKLELNHLSL